MKKHNKLNAIFIIIAAIALGLACGGSAQTEEANKIVDGANKKLEEAKELFVATEKRNTALFDVNIQTPQQLQFYKANKSEEAKSIVTDYEKVVEMMKDVSRQYDNISRMNLSEKYKDYAKLKSDEFAKRAEAINVRKGNAQAFADIADARAMNEKFDENNAKADRLFKDADDIAAKAKKMEEENKDLFKDA
jgi:hypothetical protein